MTHDEQFSESQVEETPQDDVVDKVDQLLSRHRPKTVDSSEAAAPTDAEDADAGPDDDGIPTLTDIVSSPQALSTPRRAPLEPDEVDNAAMLQRLEIALETVRTRLQVQIGEDAGQAHLLDQLVAVLKLALPDAVRSTGTEPVIELAQSAESPRL